MRERDLVYWKSLMDGHARCGEIELAKCPKGMLFRGLCLIDGFSKSGKVDEARKVFDMMPSRNLVSWNAMINGYMKLCDFDSARGLFDQMEMRNVVAWNSMIAGYELNDRFREAMEMFETMVNSGPKATHATLMRALSAASGSGLLSKGRWLHSYLFDNRFEIDGVFDTDRDVLEVWVILT
ncbi:pentatricopeptide repeat (PPR) superfamily protein [Actinidia rufa]|uniref:Pentatricopeptide repeat (PPR) superfamily protein n=1 Tax=Actinidia rufa TaxID=165716 RepID=A0A7J0FGZ1_9ERIC|nr:pentatricopeptide repeat (PPR) superfamily protein [Actinidia rufa]